ncbi:MAG: CbtA family protein [Hyphomicrobium sp.]|uniref:CbtA family protein n=1 Tax=Hyphomicrobium sp. TaxID=82 RepID=UPI0039E49E6A
MGSLLVRGMIAGLLASLLAFGFAKVLGEPQVDRAIGFEEQMAKAKGEPEEAEIVSREVQASIGLLTGVALYGTALGGLFALAFAFLNGRVVNHSPRTTAIIIAALGFLAIYIVPDLKYPANPPAVGNPDTIGYRTQLYFGMIVFSLAALAIAVSAGRQFFAQVGGWNAILIAGAIYVALTALAGYFLPPINEVPEGFPADLLWKFRVVSLGIQGILWGAVAIIFGALVERTSLKPAH